MGTAGVHIPMVLVTDERGFRDIYAIQVFVIFIFLAFTLLCVTTLAARKNAVASYQWLQEAGMYAVDCAEMNQQVGDPELYQNDVQQYFDAGFAAMTQTTYNGGGSFTPNRGSPFKGPIRVIGFSSVNVGGPTPDGPARQPGYLIGVDVPVAQLTLPLIGAQYIDVPMQIFVSLNNTKSS